MLPDRLLSVGQRGSSNRAVTCQFCQLFGLDPLGTFLEIPRVSESHFFEKVA